MNEDYEVIDERIPIVRNKNGVVGELVGYGQFVPQCCSGCKRLDSDDAGDWQLGTYFCTAMLAFPTKKGTCKFRKED